MIEPSQPESTERCEVADLVEKMCPHNPVDEDEAARLGPRNWLGPVCEPCFSEFIKSQSRALAEAEKNAEHWKGTAIRTAEDLARNADRLAEAEKERDALYDVSGSVPCVHAGVRGPLECVFCKPWAIRLRAAEERAAQAERARSGHVAEINRRLKERGFAPGELQAALRGFGGDHLAPFTTQELELGLLDAFSNMGGATVWCGDGSSCAVQIVEHQLALQEASKARALEHDNET